MEISDCEREMCEHLPQTVNDIFLYSTVSTLKPMVGIVVTISPETIPKKRTNVKKIVK